jgi:putative addiction module component (TIGR02574 family)
VEERTMAATVEEIVSEALGLPPAVRALLAERLLESLDVATGGELSPEWREEIQRRCGEIDRGTAQLHNAEDVFARAYAKLT